jgi:hypothetical protein
MPFLIYISINAWGKFEKCTAFLPSKILHPTLQIMEEKELLVIDKVVFFFQSSLIFVLRQPAVIKCRTAKKMFFTNLKKIFTLRRKFKS